MPRKKDFDEDKILEKAMVLFWQKGYHDTSIKDLIAYLGISNASIYNAFGGKKELFQRTLKIYRSHQLGGLREHLLAQAREQKEVKEVLRDMFLKLIRDDRTDEDCKGCLIVNTTIELIPADPYIQQEIQEHKMEIEAVFYDFLVYGVEQGQIKPGKNIKMISKLLYTLMTGLRVLGKVKPPEEESLDSVNAILTLLD
ncbi:MAG: TetR/AcrR family transcriptional regulator [Bacteroidota bacterium]